MCPTAESRCMCPAHYVSSLISGICDGQLSRVPVYVRSSLGQLLDFGHLWWTIISTEKMNFVNFGCCVLSIFRLVSKNHYFVSLIKGDSKHCQKGVSLWHPNVTQFTQRHYDCHYYEDYCGDLGGPKTSPSDLKKSIYFGSQSLGRESHCLVFSQ